MSARHLILLAALTSGCGTRLVDSCAGEKSACIDVQIESPTIHQLDAIDIHVSGLGIDGEKTTTRSSGARFNLPAAVAVALDQITAQGSVQVEVVGSLGGMVLGSGQATATLGPGKHTRVHVVLQGGALPDLSSGGNDLATDLAERDLSQAHDASELDNGCASNFTSCGGTCKPITNTDSCGPSCMMCSAPSNGAATCDGTSCDFTCDANFLKSGASCTACGAEGQPCCAANTCGSKLACTANLCQQKFLTWALDASGVTTNLNSVWVSSSGAHYISTVGNLLYSSTGDTNTWTGQTNPLGASASMFDVWGVGNAIYSTTSGAQAISFVTSAWGNISPGVNGYTGTGTGNDLQGIWGTNTKVYFATGGATIAALDVGTNAWSVITPGGAVTMTNTQGIWGNSTASDIYLVGGATNNHAAVVHSHNGGTFTAFDVSSAIMNLHGVWGTAAGDVYAVGDNATILHTTVGSDTWTAQTVPGTVAATTGLYSIWGSDTSGYLYVVGDDFSSGTTTVILHSIGDGTWKAETLPNLSGNGLYYIYGNTAGSDVFAVGDAGTIIRGQ